MLISKTIAYCNIFNIVIIAIENSSHSHNTGQSVVRLRNNKYVTEHILKYRYGTPTAMPMSLGLCIRAPVCYSVDMGSRPGGTTNLSL